MPSQAPALPKVIPFITPRRGEAMDPAIRIRAVPCRHPMPKLGYTLEEPEDRDPEGVLWARTLENPVVNGEREGAPRWSDVHPLRQRRTMMLLRCQVGDCPATRPDGSRLFLFAESTGMPDGEPMLTAKPPVCERHALVAARLCPMLGPDPYAVVVKRARLFGVSGVRYEYTLRGPRVVEESHDDPVPYGTFPHQNWILATQMWRQLHDYRTCRLSDLGLAS